MNLFGRWWDFPIDDTECSRNVLITAASGTFLLDIESIAQGDTVVITGKVTYSLKYLHNSGLRSIPILVGRIGNTYVTNRSNPAENMKLGMVLAHCVHNKL